MRSGEISNANSKANVSSKKFPNQTSRDNILKITGSPINSPPNSTQYPQYERPTINIPPIKNPSPTYAYQVTALTVEAAAAQ